MRAPINTNNSHRPEKWSTESVDSMSESLARLSASTHEALGSALVGGDIERIEEALNGNPKGSSPKAVGSRT
jgi:hypothetical protein